MPALLAHVYLRFLLALLSLLSAASLLLHLTALFGAKWPSAAYGLPLFRATIVVGISVAPFIKDSFGWMDQIKSCPAWMWKAAVSLGVYALFVVCLRVVFPDGPSMADQTWVITGFPLGFDAINLCILYSVVRAGYLRESEIVSRARNSALVVAACIMVTPAYRAGYLPHPQSH
jgi:hypothetical protein